MNKKTVVITHQDYKTRSQSAFDRAFVYLIAASLLWMFMTFVFHGLWPEGEGAIPEHELRVKDMMNVAMYLIPETLAGLGIANVFLIFWYSILLPVLNMADYGLSVLYRKITGRRKIHE